MEEAVVELTTFTTVGDGYVYAPLPPATSYGHRAELWNPDKWMQEVKIKVVTAGDNCFVRMLTKDSGELFAECPLPADGTPFTTTVEPVVDSSRYFVVKVVDRESRKHAFVGIGFRDRMDASDFAAALDDYRQYLRRKQEAEQLRQDFSTLQPPSSGEAGTDGQQAGGSAAAAKDFSLKPGETLHIKLSPSLKRGDSGNAAAGAGASLLRSASGNSSSSNSSPGSAVPGAIPRLVAPPSSSSSGGSSSSSSSSSGFFRLQPPPPSAAGAAAAAAAAAGVAGTSNSSAAVAALKGSAGQQQQQQGEQPSMPEEDDWGDFVG